MPRGRVFHRQHKRVPLVWFGNWADRTFGDRRGKSLKRHSRGGYLWGISHFIGYTSRFDEGAPGVEVSKVPKCEAPPPRGRRPVRRDPGLGHPDSNRFNNAGCVEMEMPGDDVLRAFSGWAVSTTCGRSGGGCGRRYGWPSRRDPSRDASGRAHSRYPLRDRGRARRRCRLRVLCGSDWLA